MTFGACEAFSSQNGIYTVFFEFANSSRGGYFKVCWLLLDLIWVSQQFRDFNPFQNGLANFDSRHIRLQLFV